MLHTYGLNVTYTEQPILKALTFKGITLSHSIQNKSRIEHNIYVTKVYRNIMTQVKSLQQPTTTPLPCYCDTRSV